MHSPRPLWTFSWLIAASVLSSCSILGLRKHIETLESGGAWKTAGVKIPQASSRWEKAVSHLLI